MTTPPGQVPTHPQPLPYGDPTTPAGATRQVVTASWLQRVGAYLVDVLVAASPWLVVGPYAWVTAERTPSPLGHTNVMTTPAADWAMLAAIAVQVTIWVWQRLVRHGRTGRTVGKQLLGLRLVDARTGAPVGVGRAVGREVAHVLDYPALIGYLSPLWHPAGQTFADKIARTLVVRDR